MADLSDVVPILIVGYVLFGIISAFVRLIRQAGKANQAQPAAAAAPPSPGLTADQVRANLARRRIAQARAAAAAPAVPAVVAAPPAPPPRIYDVTASSMDPLSISSVGLLSGPAPDISLVKLWTTLPPAAVAVLASAIIGPCAARRGSGHQPEDW
jgi:hypothetical protein